MNRLAPRLDLRQTQQLALDEGHARQRQGHPAPGGHPDAEVPHALPARVLLATFSVKPAISVTNTVRFSDLGMLSRVGLRHGPCCRRHCAPRCRKHYECE